MEQTVKVDRKSKEYKKQKAKRILEAQQDSKYDFPNPRKGTAFPESDFLKFHVVQDKKEIKLATYRYKPTNGLEPKGLFLLFHGLNSSITHGSHIAKAFAEAGFCVVGFDHRGFGNSEGRRGFVESLEIHLQDCRTFINLIEDLYGKQIKKFIGGLSMGGMSSYNMSLEQPFRFAGVILMAPAIKNMNEGVLVGLVKAVGSVVSKWNFIKQKGTNCHRSLAIAKDQAEDPHSYIEEMCCGTVKSIFTGMDKSHASFSQYNAPFVIIQGGLDKLVDPDVGYELMEKSRSKDKSRKLNGSIQNNWYYEEMWHDVWHEPEIVEIIPRMIAWCEQRL